NLLVLVLRPGIGLPRLGCGVTSGLTCVNLLVLALRSSIGLAGRVTCHLAGTRHLLVLVFVAGRRLISLGRCCASGLLCARASLMLLATRPSGVCCDRPRDRDSFPGRLQAPCWNRGQLNRALFEPLLLAIRLQTLGIRWSSRLVLHCLHLG